MYSHLDDPDCPNLCRLRQLVSAVIVGTNLTYRMSYLQFGNERISPLPAPHARTVSINLQMLNMVMAEAMLFCGYVLAYVQCSSSRGIRT